MPLQDDRPDALAGPRQEVKDELKQADGDPIVKARLRSIARDRQRKRMMAAVPRATLVIANPTHYAVALRYVREEGGAPLDKGAALSAFLASEASDGITGRLLSAVWDNWTELPARQQHLAKSDIYTLRRIVPEDRGQKWQCA